MRDRRSPTQLLRRRFPDLSATVRSLSANSFRHRPIVATILRTNPIKVLIQVAEADIPYVGIGRGVSVQVDAYKDRKFAGTVIAVNPAVDPVSRSAVVEASVENGDNTLRQGMFATVRINREGGGKAVFVPKTAV